MLNRYPSSLLGLVLVSVVTAPQLASALTADLGSNGSYGAINVTTDTVIALPADGVIHATTINVAVNARLSFSYTGIAHPGVVLLATGNVVIAGTLDVSGAPSTANTAGRAGPGGSSGGAPSSYYAAYPLLQPSQLLPAASSVETGLRPRGGHGGYSAHSTTACTTSAAGGGGGGGSLVIISNTSVVVSGTIDARGGSANSAQPSGCVGGSRYSATVGEDGYVRVIAPAATMSGASVVAQGIRVDTVAISGAPTVTRGSVSGAGTLEVGTALVRFPSLPVPTIIAVNGTTVAPSTAISIPASTPNPFNVTVRVVGCSGPVLRAAVHSRLANGSYNYANTELLNPTGDDNVVVSINTSMSVAPNANSALLFPAVWCGTVTYP